MSRILSGKQQKLQSKIEVQERGRREQDKKKKSEAQIQYFGWKPAPCRFNRVVNWKMEQRDVWEGVGRVAKGWVPLHGSGDSRWSVTFSGFIADLSPGQSQSVNVTAISADLKADGGFSSRRAFPLSVQRDGLIPAFFYPLLTTPDLLSSEPPARPTVFFSRSPSFKQRGEEKPVTFAAEKTDVPPNKITHKLKVIFNKWPG